MSTKFRSIMYIFQVNFQETVIFSALTAFTDIIVHFLLNIKNVIEIIIPIDYLMLKYISRHLSCYFLVPALSFICSQLQVYLSAAVHTYNIRIPSKGFFFFCVGQNKQSSSRKATYYPNKLSMHTFKSEFIHGDKDLDLLVHPELCIMTVLHTQLRIL